MINQSKAALSMEDDFRVRVPVPRSVFVSMMQCLHYHVFHTQLACDNPAPTSVPGKSMNEGNAVVPCLLDQAVWAELWSKNRQVDGWVIDRYVDALLEQ